MSLHPVVEDRAFVRSQVGGGGFGITRGREGDFGNGHNSPAFGAFTMFRRRDGVDFQPTPARAQEAKKSIGHGGGGRRGIGPMSDSNLRAAFGTDDPLVPSARDG